MSRSQWWEGPVKAAPDFEQLLKVLRREVPDRPTLFEFFLNQPLHAHLAADTTGLEPDSPEETVVAFRNAGYDYATILASDFHFPGGNTVTPKPAPLTKAASSEIARPLKPISGRTRPWPTSPAWNGPRRFFLPG